MTRAECIAKAEEWLEQAEQSMEWKVTLGLAANQFARSAVAASIANVYATLALSATE